jgi:membrane protease YdiL (CAAX protease family)
MVCWESGMLGQPETDDFRNRLAEVEAQRVPASEVARWFVPWILAAVLILVLLGSLWCASSAADDGTYAIGLVGAALALIALIWELRAAFGDGIGSLSAHWLVDDETSLVVLAAILTVLALGGLILAASGASVAASGTGYGLCLFAIVVIAANLKHYFDRRETR